jgi:MFS transporter, ACS family, D-galactonate transporter
VQAIVAAHPQQVAVLSAVDDRTSAALAKNPQDVGALATALGEVARQQGADATEARAVSTAVTTRAPQLAAAQAVDPATLQALLTNPADAAAGAKAVGQIATALKVDVPTATQLLRSLGDRAVQADVLTVQKYATVLTSAQSAIPAADLAYLSAHADEVTQAQRDNPHQWQTWWWVCVVAQLVLLPFVFLMTGRWSPRRAREDEAAHEQRVAEELARLQGARG